MDEDSWRECQIKLAKSNINILNIEWGDERKECTVYYEFSYHPQPGKINWHKTVYEISGEYNRMQDYQHTVYYDTIVDTLLKNVLKLRKKLES